jgi:hypothetical protein
MSDPLITNLRQVADNLDRAASISAQYCASGHHTAAIREAADRLERDAAELARVRRERDGLREAHQEIVKECREWASSEYWSTESMNLCNRLTQVSRAALAAPKGATP